MVAYTFRMPAGVPGDVNRLHGNGVIESQIQSGTPVTLYGVAVAVDSSTQGMRPITTGDVAATCYGVSVRPYPLQAQSTTNFGAVALGGTTTPPATGAIDILKSGYVTIKVNDTGTAAKGNPVYVRVAGASGAKVVGGFETASDTSNTIAFPNAYFTGAQDANGFVEIAVNP